MKKGLTIALLMVAMVALAASASAVAPVIGNLPAVIIGDAGDVSGVATEANSLHLLRYVNVFNLADPGIIDRLNNPTDASKLKVFYQARDLNGNLLPSLQASNPARLINPLTDAEEDLLVSTGTVNANKNIVPDAANTWLSLIQNASTAVSARTATAKDNGSTFADLEAAGAVVQGQESTSGTATVTLYAADGATTANGASLVSTGVFTVYSVIGQADNFSPAERVYSSKVTPGKNPVDNWVGAGRNSGTLQPGVLLTTTTGIGFRGIASFSAGKDQANSYWQHVTSDLAATVMAPAKNMDGKIYRATIKLTGDASEPQYCPAFRFLYASLAFSHFGGFQMLTPPGGEGIPNVTEANYPSAANPEVSLQMYWAVPTDMVGYGDSGVLTTLQSGVDFRDYFIVFDLMQDTAGDVGSVIMESLTIDRILRPADTTAAIQWGSVTRNFATTTGKAFNDAAAGWIKGTSDLNTGFGLGTVSITADAVNLAMSTNPGTTGVFQQVAAAPTAIGFPKWESNKLIRTTYNVASSNAATCPQLRGMIIPYVRPYFAMGNALWADVVSPATAAGRYLPSKYPYQASAPKTTGSVWESYYFTNGGLDPSLDSALTTAFDIQQARVSPPTGWSKATATVKIKGLSIEVLN